MDLKKLAVVMNPPYQINDGGGTGSSAKPLYHKFIESSIDFLSVDYLISINPSRWMVGGKGLNKFRVRMKNDRRIKAIKHIRNSVDIFPTVEIKGGVNYFLWERDYSGDCLFHDGYSTMYKDLSTYDILLVDNFSNTIIESVTTQCSEFINSKCIPRKPFGISGHFNDWSEIGTPCVSRGNIMNLVDASKYTDRFNIKDKHKACLSTITSGVHIIYDENDSRKIINNIFALPPDTICTETYLVIRVFDTMEENLNFISYIRTKFFRFMLGIRVITQNLSRDKFSFVPDLIDYTRSYTDEELYEMFNLTEEQQAYIESKIKPLE